jgi:hypothetical protein
MTNHERDEHDDDKLDDEAEIVDEEMDEELDDAIDADEDDALPVIGGGNVPDDETIGGLHFVANPEFPYPLDIPKPPRFWMEEQTGVLNDAVETYMRGDALKPPQLAAIKTYITQYLERAPLTGDAHVGVLLRKLERVRSTRDLENYADEIAEYGAEVF